MGAVEGPEEGLAVGLREVGDAEGLAEGPIVGDDVGDADRHSPHVTGQ